MFFTILLLAIKSVCGSFIHSPNSETFKKRVPNRGNTFYWSPATVHAENDFLIGSDTIPESRRFNSQQWGILFGKRFVLGRRNEVGIFNGIEWGVIQKFDHYFALIELFHMEVGLKSAYKYSTPDYRSYNKALGYGTHNFSMNFSFREVTTKH